MKSSSPKNSIKWQVFPRNRRTTTLERAIIKVFEEAIGQIGTPENGLRSNDVLAVVRPGLEELDFLIEGTSKVARPVLYGESDRPAKTFNVDGFHEASGTVLEVEAGQAVENNRFAIDLLKALSIQDAEHLVMAIPANYHPERLRSAGKPPKKEFDEVVKVLDALYSAGRVSLPLVSIVVVGY